MIKFGESERYKMALNYANEKYKGLKREVSYIPYIFHPRNVVSILRLSGYDDSIEHEDLLISALLHDVLEETNAEVSEIEEVFGKRVAKIVSELTKPEDLKKEDWLEGFKDYSKEAKIVKLAERIANLSSMESSFFSKERISRDREQAKIILRTCGDVSTSLYSKLFNLIYYGIKPRSTDEIMIF